MHIKKSLIKFICSIILSLTFGGLLIWFFSGPRLDFMYDFLMSRKKAPEAAPEIVLIDTDQGFASANISDPALIASVLMTLTEFDAGPAIIQTSVLGISPRGILPDGTDENQEIISQVSDEFRRIEENIGNLFQGIRTGSISPLESELYVDELIGLIDRGKDRLLDSVSEQELAGLRFFENAVRVKHDVWMKDEYFLMLNQPDDKNDDSQSNLIKRHTAYRPDSDGVLRRIIPLLYLEDGIESHYLMWDVIKDRLNPQEIRFTDNGILFTRMQGRGFENKDFLFHTDKNHALLLDGLGKKPAFRQFSLNDFLAYNELDQVLFLKLEEMETLGYYDSLPPEKHPTALYRHALAIRDELFRETSLMTVEDWIEARQDYFSGIKDFFLSGVETNLVTRYEELIASEELEDSVKQELVSMRNSLIKTFQECRKAYDNVSELRENLEIQLKNTFCILGPVGSIQSSWGIGGPGNPGETEAAAIFANTFLTDNLIIPVDDLQAIFWIFLWVFFLSFFIRNANTIVTILVGTLAAVLSIVFFSSLFVYWDLWIHPIIPAGALFFASFVSITVGLIFKHRFALELRRAYSPYVSSSVLKKIIKRTGPEPWETITAYSSIVAVRSSSVYSFESKDSPVMTALAVRNFRDEVSQLFKDAGAVIIGGDGDLVLAAFASPLERSALWNAGITHQYMNHSGDTGKVNPVDKAIFTVLGILKRKNDIDSWSFGIDCDECAFTYSDASGYSAFGHSVVKARLLSRLSHKYQTKVLISEAVKLHSGLPIKTRQLDILVERELGTKEPFFALVN